MADALIHYQNSPADYPPPDWNGNNVRATSAAARHFPPPPADIKSILILKLDAMGDHVLHTPFFHHLRALYPHANITLVCAPANINLAETNPNFDFIVPVDFPAGTDQRRNFMFALELQSHAAAPFDLIILPRWSEDWHHAGVIAQTLDSPYRLTYSAISTPLKKLHALQHDDFFTHVIDEPTPAHEVWRGAQLLHALGMKPPRAEDLQLKIYSTAADEEKIERFLAGKNLPRPWIGFGIGASAHYKRWPAENFAALAEKISGTIFIFGNGAEDEAAAQTILMKRKDCVNATRNLSARETGVLIGHCDTIVCNDSYALHAAAAADVPAVELVGHPADGCPDSEYLPRRFGPWGPRFAWLQPVTCQNSNQPQADYLNESKCIGDIPASIVLTAIKELCHG